MPFLFLSSATVQRRCPWRAHMLPASESKQRLAGCPLAQPGVAGNAVGAGVAGLGVGTPGGPLVGFLVGKG